MRRTLCVRSSAFLSRTAKIETDSGHTRSYTRRPQRCRVPRIFPYPCCMYIFLTFLTLLSSSYCYWILIVNWFLYWLLCFGHIVFWISTCRLCVWALNVLTACQRSPGFRVCSLRQLMCTNQKGMSILSDCEIRNTDRVTEFLDILGYRRNIIIELWNSAPPSIRSQSRRDPVEIPLRSRRDPVGIQVMSWAEHLVSDMTN